MFWLVLALVIAVFTASVIGWLRHKAKRPVQLLVAHDLADRITAATRAFAKAAPWQPASSDGAPEAAAAIEAALIAREPKRALELAELSLVASSDNKPNALWLAWALCANGQPVAALDQIAAWRSGLAAIASGGGGGSAADARSALASYVEARAEHLKFEHGVGAAGSMPPLVTAADVAVVTLARGRGGAAWLTGAQQLDGQLSSSDVKAAVAEHREITARCLEGGLAALAAQPGFVDAAYLVARLAVKAGFLAEAAALFEQLESRIAGRPDADAFERDRRDLGDPTAAVANARIKPASPTSKRSRSLKVLS